MPECWGSGHELEPPTCSSCYLGESSVRSVSLPLLLLMPLPCRSFCLDIRFRSFQALEDAIRFAEVHIKPEVKK